MTIEIKNISEAVARIRYLFQANNKRIIIGIVGKPGAGKSTFAAELIKNLTDLNPTLVPMDGYHLSNKQLKKLNL
jgi:uridine kinase